MTAPSALPGAHHEVLVVLNPISGRGAALGQRPAIEAALAAVGLQSRVVVSAFHGHGISLVADAVAAGLRRVLVVGGDGSLNEAVNGLLTQQAVPATEVLLAVLPVGTGNDWVRGHGNLRDVQGVAARLAANQGRRVDAGVARCVDGPRYFVNVAGLGFDSAVLEAMPSRRWGPLAYLLGLLGTLVRLPRVRAGVSLDNGPHQSLEALVLFACLGPYCGGGMWVAPDARPDNGRLEFTGVGAMSRLRLLGSLKRLFDGTIKGHPRVVSGRCRTLRVDTAQAVRVETDGELAGYAPVIFEVLPQALRVAL